MLGSFYIWGNLKGGVWDVGGMLVRSDILKQSKFTM